MKSLCFVPFIYGFQFQIVKRKKGSVGSRASSRHSSPANMSGSRAGTPGRDNRTRPWRAGSRNTSQSPGRVPSSKPVTVPRSPCLGAARWNPPAASNRHGSRSNISNPPASPSRYGHNIPSSPSRVGTSAANVRRPSRGRTPSPSPYDQPMSKARSSPFRTGTSSRARTPSPSTRNAAVGAQRQGVGQRQRSNSRDRANQQQQSRPTGTWGRPSPRAPPSRMSRENSRERRNNIPSASSGYASASSAIARESRAQVTRATKDDFGGEMGLTGQVRFHSFKLSF